MSSKSSISSEESTFHLPKIDGYLKDNYQQQHQLIIPHGCKYLDTALQRKLLQEHHKKIEQAKPVVDASSPIIFAANHGSRSVSRLQSNQKRLSEIDRQNRQMLEAIMKIFESKATFCHNYTYEQMNNSRQKKRTKNGLSMLSYNTDVLLKNLMNTKSEYCREKFLKEFEHHEKLLACKSKYPNEWRQEFLNKKQKQISCETLATTY